MATETRIWSVVDQNAYQLDDKGEPKPRNHEPVAGKRYPLFAHKATQMPEAHARVFLKDPAYIVRDENDEIVPSLEATQMDREPPETLEPDMVVAKLDELTTDALLTRVSVLAGGAGFTHDTPREQLIDFITEAQTPKRPARGDDDLADGAHEGMSAAQLAKMLPAGEHEPSPKGHKRAPKRAAGSPLEGG